MTSLELALYRIKRQYKSRQCVRHIVYGDTRFYETERLARNSESQALHKEFRRVIVSCLWRELECGLYRAVMNWRGDIWFMEIREKTRRCASRQTSLDRRHIVSYRTVMHRGSKKQGYKRQYRTVRPRWRM